MSDSKAAAELIRQLRKMRKDGVEVVVVGANSRARVIKNGREVVIPGPKQRTSGCAIPNARAALRRELGIDI